MGLDVFNVFNYLLKKLASPIFASGIVNGYFDNEVPLEFWKLLALYISSNMLSSIPWAIPFGESEVNNMINQAKDVLSWYNNMQTTIPTWYIGSSSNNVGEHFIDIFKF